jgi:hypothetical protein
VLSEWNAIHSEKSKLVLLPVGWESHSAPEMGETPQSIINKTVLKDCDLLVGIFWTKVGTATEGYESGTVEEIERHIDSGRPTMIYFSSQPVALDSVDADQYQRLKTFKQSCLSRGLYDSYTSPQDFRSKFSRHIQLKINQSFQASSPIPAQAQDVPSIAMINLTRESQELLRVAAASDGQIMHIRSLGGTRLQAENRAFIEDRNPRSEAIWMGALQELENRGFVESRGSARQVFRVTRDGYEYYDLNLKTQ